MADTRVERDTMGEMAVPSDALYGAQTARAVQNFPIGTLRLQRPFLRALGLIKACAARVNGLPEVERAALEVAAGRYDDQFVVDVFQTGSGTSTNMNANEVISHLAEAHPNDDVNRGQSSNDVFPSAMHIAAAQEVTRRLLPAIRELAASLRGKSKEFGDVLKIARTHLQDAVPMFLGQEFSGYAHQVERADERIAGCLPGLLELALGGTAAGTGLNAPAGFAAKVIAEIAAETALPFVEAPNHFEAQAAKDAVVALSGALRGYAVALTKIANDLRWLGSGPRCGIGEIRIPPVQPGSSIMPGKVNPVIAESVLMVCAQVIGYDAAIAWSAAAGNFELNVMMPVIAWDLLESIAILSNASENLARKLVDGLEVDRDRAAGFIEQSLAMCTALAPEIGYENAAALAKEAHRSGRTIRQVANEKSGLAKDRLNELLDPATQANPEIDRQK